MKQNKVEDLRRSGVEAIGDFLSNIMMGIVCLVVMVLFVAHFLFCAIGYIFAWLWTWKNIQPFKTTPPAQADPDYMSER